MPILEMIFVTLTFENSSVVTNDTQGPRKYSPPEIAVGTHFHVWHGAKTILVVLPTDEETSCLVLPSLDSLLSGDTATREDLFLYPQGDRSGLTKPKKDKHQH